MPDSTISRKPDAKFLLAHPAHFLALGFGAGLAPRAPGTFGTLAAFPVWGLLTLVPPQIAWLAVAAGFVFGIHICDRAGIALGAADHGAIVWDEIVAMLAVLLLAPRGWAWAVAAFAAFRLFDIWKPFPIGYLDRNVKGGFGVMLDDVAAAAYAIVALLLLEQVLKGIAL